MPVPGGELSNRPLRFFWVLDVSGSMGNDGKIGKLNHAIREALRPMKDVAEDNAEAAVEVKVMTFGTNYEWITKQPVRLDDFSWTDVSADGYTDMGAAMRGMAQELSVENMSDRALPPVVVLVTDGHPTDDFDSGLAVFMAQPWAQKAVRIGIGIGSDADMDVLRKFMASEIEPLEARNSNDLVKYIRWVSTKVLQAASAPASQPLGSSSVPVTPMSTVPKPPPKDVTAQSVW